MSETCSVESVVPTFNSVSDLRSGLEAKSNFEAVDLYPRDGSSLLGEVERAVAGLAGITEEALLVYNSGMSAVTDAIDVALHQSTNEPPTLLCSAETYSQSKRYIENFIAQKRARVAFFDSGDPNATNRAIDKWKPAVIVAETISNYISVPVLDTQNLLAKARESDSNPIVILDNTLPLSTASPLGEILNEEDRVIVVESGTKSYTFNGSLLGVGYTQNQELFNWLQKYRRTRGSLPGPEHLECIGDYLPTDRETFDDRNRLLFKNTGDIALRLASATNGSSEFIISHPGLTSHDNHEFYAEQYPDGATPIFYILSTRLDQYSVAERLWASPGVREQAELGQSFGFDHARIVTDENIAAVRISGGAQTDGEALGEALASALLTDG